MWSDEELEQYRLHLLWLEGDDEGVRLNWANKKFPKDDDSSLDLRFAILDSGVITGNHNLDSIAHLKDKTVLPVCTGGVRCEKASGLLLREGFKDVYQIEDGMVSFIENFPNQEFEGSLYVFDGRITVTYDDKDKHKVVGECSVCQSPTEIFSNCANKSCNKKMLCCSDCLPNKDTMYCSEECEKVMSGKNLVKLNE
jgi:rhodanese-related sulfurtransferase